MRKKTNMTQKVIYNVSRIPSSPSSLREKIKRVRSTEKRIKGSSKQLYVIFLCHVCMYLSVKTLLIILAYVKISYMLSSIQKKIFKKIVQKIEI